MKTYTIFSEYHEDGLEMNDYSHESAAEAYAEFLDMDGVEYSIVSGDSISVTVDDGEISKKFSVSGEVINRYSAREIE
jgi:hypothetical protein